MEVCCYLMRKRSLGLRDTTEPIVYGFGLGVNLPLFRGSRRVCFFDVIMLGVGLLIRSALTTSDR